MNRVPYTQSSDLRRRFWDATVRWLPLWIIGLASLVNAEPVQAGGWKAGIAKARAFIHRSCSLPSGARFDP